MKRKPSKAQQAQRKHWQLTGQLAIIHGMANYLLSDSTLDPFIRHKLSIVRIHAWQALSKELKNNQFIHLNLPRGF